ncbi:hypothetical protein B0H17DRAFT_1134571 [Mycena rosella]|uniref:Uncharacterized protein n=1 Tax=Mycena rosella TaxID=1033263 RepID=A0AAD7DFP0_MYCRO|nr:hypothetical protein B0H17DRAFT_1134571 [Mycena rosella]
MNSVKIIFRMKSERSEIISIIQHCSEEGQGQWKDSRGEEKVGQGMRRRWTGGRDGDGEQRGGKEMEKRNELKDRERMGKSTWNAVDMEGAPTQRFERGPEPQSALHALHKLDVLCLHPSRFSSHCLTQPAWLSARQRWSIHTPHPNSLPSCMQDVQTQQMCDALSSAISTITQHPFLLSVLLRTAARSHATSVAACPALHPDANSEGAPHPHRQCPGPDTPGDHTFVHADMSMLPSTSLTFSGSWHAHQYTLHELDSLLVPHSPEFGVRICLTPCTTLLEYGDATEGVMGEMGSGESSGRELN